MDAIAVVQPPRKRQKVFPTLDLLGWYTTGATLGAHHVAIHEVMSADPTMDNDTPLFMLLNTNPSPTERELPIQFYESIKEMEGDHHKT